MIGLRRMAGAGRPFGAVLAMSLAAAACLAAAARPAGGARARDEVDGLVEKLRPPARFKGYKPDFRVVERTFTFQHVKGPVRSNWRVVMDGEKYVALVRSGDFNLLALTPGTARTRLKMPTGRYHLDTQLGPTLCTHQFLKGVKVHGAVYTAETAQAGDRWEGGGETITLVRSVKGDERTVHHRFTVGVDAVHGYNIVGRYEARFREPPTKNDRFVGPTFCPGCYTLWPETWRYERTVYCPGADQGAYRGWANNLISMDRGDRWGKCCWRDKGFIAYLDEDSGWSPCRTRVDGGGDVYMPVCNAHNDFHVRINLPKHLPKDADGWHVFRATHRLLALPPELTKHVRDRMDLYGKGQSAVMIRIGVLEDFEGQPIPVTRPVRGLTWTSGGPRVTTDQAHSGSKSVLLKGTSWPNLPQCSLLPETKYRLEAWYKLVPYTDPERAAAERKRKRPIGKVVRAYVKGDFYEWSPHSRKWIVQQQTNVVTSEKDGWQRVSLEFTTPKWDPFINVVFVVEDGKAYLDDFRLIRLGGVEAPPPAGAAEAVLTPAGAGLREAASRAAIVRDWMLQDYMGIRLPKELEAQKEQWRGKHLRARESKADAPVLAKLPCFAGAADAVVERRMVDRVLAELHPGGASIRAEAGSLARDAAPGRDARWKKLYLRACELRRRKRLGPLLARWRRFVLSQHRHNRGSWKYTEGPSDSAGSRAGFLPGSSLNVLEMDGVYGKLRTLIEDRKGFLRNPDVSYDGKRMLFAWKKSRDDDDLHLYEMDLASEQVRPLTRGLGYADYEGVYLPDGNILFNSTRCFQTTPCNVNVVSNFYLLHRDRRSMRRVGFDQVHTIFPTVSDDGRVLYTRWEYVDRGQIYPQPLFQMNPDGTNQREYYGGNSWFPTNILHARKIPGTTKVVAIVTGHHRPAAGKLAVIDPARGLQEESGVQLVAPVRKTEPIRKDKYGEGGDQFQYPYPLDEQRFLVTLALPTPEGKLGRFNSYFIDAHGGRELLVEGDEPAAGIGCKQIIPLAARERPHVRPSLADYRRGTGTVYLQDVHEGPGLKGVPRGTVKRLRVVAVRYQAASFGRLSQSGKGGSSNVLTPIAIGHGSWDVKEVLGSVKVHADGSAFFEVPARTPLYFQALDANNCAVQTMRSWTTLMPGENQSCVGCHEPGSSAPPTGRRVAMALEGGPDGLTNFYGPPRGFSFAREVQPILNRHCVRCHTGRKDKPFSLSGEAVEVGKTKRLFSRAYLALTHARGSNGEWNHPVVNWIDSMSEPSMLPPYHRGAATSKLTAMLERGHNDVKLSGEEMDKIACWIDLLVPYCGDFTEAHAWSAEELNRYNRFLAKRKAMDQIERANIRAWIPRPESGASGRNGR